MKTNNPFLIIATCAVLLGGLAYLFGVTLNGIFGDMGPFGTSDGRGLGEHQHLVLDHSGTPWWLFYFTLIRPTAYLALAVATAWSAFLVARWAWHSMKG